MPAHHSQLWLYDLYPIQVDPGPPAFQPHWLSVSQQNSPYYTFCVQLGKPFPGLLKSGVFKCHPRDHPSYVSLCPTRSIFIANCFLLRAFILCPSFCLPAYFLSLHPGTLRAGTSGTAMVSPLACRTLAIISCY